DFTTARALLEESLGIRRQMGDSASAANVMFSLASPAVGQSDIRTARGWLEEGLASHRDLGDWRMAYSLSYLALIHFFDNDHALARTRLLEALRIQRDIGNPISVASSLTTLGMVAHAEGDDETAARSLHEALATLHGLGNESYVCEALEAVAAVVSV